ncbi:type II toxin-antitoxin system RelE/ParE family toxin [Candidatus Gracilibacteria bacterium]|nr:type II toxin-antitoxin system RelE/ParE family toxin [Candidatus Gracilibacteria bacterium]
MFKIKYTKQAKNNIRNIFGYIAGDNLIVATQTLQKIYSSISHIQIFPYIGKQYNIYLREFIESKYKFRIIYQVDESNSQIIILDVLKYRNTF